MSEPSTPIEFPAAAYTGEHFDAVYDEVSARLGYRPSFSVTAPVDQSAPHRYMHVHSTEPDIAREIIDETVRRSGAAEKEKGQA